MYKIKETAKKTWEALREQQFTVKTMKCAAKKNCYGLTNKPGKPMRPHIAQFKNIHEDLVRMGCNFTEKGAAEHLINTFSGEKFRHMKQIETFLVSID